jgi:hypothetical protein
MADKKKGGRYTPPKASRPEDDKPAPKPGAAVRRPRRPLLDERARTEMAKRPQSLRYQFTMSALWIAAGIVTFIVIPSSWKLVPAMFCVAIGIFSLRGAVRTALRGDAEDPGTRPATKAEPKPAKSAAKATRSETNPTTKSDPTPKAARTKPAKPAKSAKGDAPEIMAPRARRRGGQDSSR